jgi:hypothetical protein
MQGSCICLGAPTSTPKRPLTHAVTTNVETPETTGEISARIVNMYIVTSFDVNRYPNFGRTGCITILSTSTLEIMR